MDCHPALGWFGPALALELPILHIRVASKDALPVVAKSVSLLQLEKQLALDYCLGRVCAVLHV